MIRPRVVIDTNILVSAALTRKSFEATTVKLVGAGRLSLCSSCEILLEYERVLRRTKFKLEPNLIEYFLRLGRDAAVLITPTVRVSVSPDEPDNRFLECAEAAEADYLVTGNKKHFPDHWKRTRIVNARELLDLLDVSASL
jgi:putative PIN family toxin of toxin-antitoxin system